MRIIGKFISLLLSLIFPPRVRRSVSDRLNLTAMAFTSNIELRVFWHIVFLPITLPLSLIVAIVKTILIWVLPAGLFSDIKYLFNVLQEDVSERHMPLKLALKRMKIGYELFSKGREKEVSFGEKNPDKTFFVIRPFYYMETNELITTISNLLYHYYRTLQHLSYAIKNGWIPVIDWENYGPFPHGEDEPVNGTRNCWEYFWNQPSEYTLEEVYQSKHVILSSQNTVDYQLIPPVAFYTPFSRYVSRLIELCPQYDQYITLNEPTASYVQKRQDELFPKNARILGVSVRGAAYGAKRIPGHPVQPDIDNLIIETKEKMEEWKLDYVFFCCEMAEKVEKMKEAFGDKLISLPRKRYEKLPTSEDNPLYVPGQRYQTNLDYLTEMALLSRCDCLLAGMSGGVRTAIIWNAGQYRKIQIFERDMWME